MKTKELVDGYNIYKSESELKDIGSTITSYRKRKALSQTSLGSIMGLKKAQVCKIEKGENLTISTISKVFSAMDINVSVETEPRISENRLTEVLDDMVMTIFEFADKYGLSPSQAFRYLDNYGGIEHLLMFYDSIKNESVQHTVEELECLCRRKGGKI